MNTVNSKIIENVVHFDLMKLRKMLALTENKGVPNLNKHKYS